MPKNHRQQGSTKTGAARAAATTAVSSRQAAQSISAPQNVSARWIATALALILVFAGFCVWGTLCFTFWQGSWQLLYHPQSAIAQTPAHVGLPFDTIDFAATQSGQPQLHGWWIPAPAPSRFTAIYLHGADGNMGNVVPALLPLHEQNLNVLVFDYRGYGESLFARPSEQHWREDAESAIEYLTGTRHLPAKSLVLVGSGLGANLALELAAAHPELAGVILEDPTEAPEDAVFNDPRAHLVPAHSLVSDRWDLMAAAKGLRIPSLWIESGTQAYAGLDRAFEMVPAKKNSTRLRNSPNRAQHYAQALSSWFHELGESPSGQ